MCGIAGILLTNPNPNLINRVSNITKDLVHRGPDASGFFKIKNTLLVHTRLSIVDLENGNQPIVNNNLVLVANGEIYNDLEIRKKYKSYNFKTKSDSESIMTLYHEKGIEGLKELRGMYAFALFDKKQKKTILGRDIFGIKPLFFINIKGGIIFSSEMQSLRNLNLVDNKISNKKLLEFLELQYCSGRGTIHENIHRIRPGEILMIQNGRIQKSELQKFPKKTTIKKNVDSNFIQKNISESISVHLRSDVPYCLFFSGGIDSMLIMYFMNQISLKKKSAYKVNIENKKTDNSILKKISNKFNIEFNEISFTEKDFWKLLPFAAKQIDEPVADYAILPTFKLAEKASKDFKVAITGEGGDELFGGYGRYKNSYYFLRQNFYKGALSKLKKKINRESLIFETNQLFIENLNLTKLQKFQYFDFVNWLPNNLLVKLDRCLMSYGMEGRTPLIDKKLYENFYYVNDNVKIKRGFGKYFVRKFLDENIEFYDAFSKKKGFTIPIYEWIPKKSKKLEELLPRVSILNNIFEKEEIIELCRSTSNQKRNIRILWHLIFFTAWYKINIEKKNANGDFFDIISN